MIVQILHLIHYQGPKFDAGQHTNLHVTTYHNCWPNPGPRPPGGGNPVLLCHPGHGASVPLLLVSHGPAVVHQIAVQGDYLLKD